MELDPMFIDVRVTEEQNNEWRLTGMYGEFRWEHKHRTWERMRRLHHNNTLPWLLIENLNEIQILHEKEGGNPRPHQYMHAFQAAIEDCELRDMGYVGDQFMWFRGRIRERLVRGLVNDAWSTLYPHAALQNLNYNHSDHRPLCVDTEYYSGVAANGAASKKFEARWLAEETVEEVVKTAWHKVA